MMLQVVDPVAGAEVEAHLVDLTTHGFKVTDDAPFNLAAPQRKVDSGAGLGVFELAAHQVFGLVLCPESTLEMLEGYLQRLFEKHKPAISLSEDEMQILTLIYSGLDFASIENIAGMSTDELNTYYDRLVDSGLAKVVKIRKEIELTPHGVSMVDKISKR